VRAWSIPRWPWAVALPDFFLPDLLLVDFPDFEDLWVLEEVVVVFEEVEAAADPTNSSEATASATDWRILRLKCKRNTSGEIYEFQ
jgi:hypothetical protein